VGVTKVDMHEAKTRLSELAELAQQGGSLPPLHRDPFDRMLVAQAQAEGLELVTADADLAGYGVRLVDASV